MKSLKSQSIVKNYANFGEEIKLWRQGCNFVVGLDEVGRGPLAGPVCASAVCFGAPKQTAESKFKINSAKFKIWEKIKDSKKLSAGQREEWYKILISHPDIKYGIGIVSEKIIDKINIFEATKLAMKKALEDLGGEPNFLLIDGNFTLSDVPINQKAIVCGDEKVFSIAAASIIAKVTRDRIMRKYAKKFPQYGFEKHKGYGTRQHLVALRKHGTCKIHRMSFHPVKVFRH